MTFKQKLTLVLVAGLVVVVLDQATKIWARSALLAPGDVGAAVLGEKTGKRLVIPVVGSRPGMEFRLSFNKGAAFGLFNQTTGSRIFLSIIGLGALFLVGYLLRRPESDSRLFVWALALVAGGAVGNLIDRIAFGQVTDFIYVWLTSSVRWLWPWPGFNIADIALVVGVGLMVLGILLTRPDKEGAAEKKGETGDDGGKKKKKGKR